FFSSRRRHTRFSRDWSSDVCSSDLASPRMPKDRICSACIALSRRRLSPPTSVNSLSPDWVGETLKTCWLHASNKSLLLCANGTRSEEPSWREKREQSQDAASPRNT